MGEEGKSFGAIVVASVALIMASKYLVTAMIVGMSARPLDVPLLLDSTVVTAVTGVALVVVAGAFVTTVAFARAFAILTFAIVGVLGQVWVTPVEPIVVGETAVAALAVLFLLLYDPIVREERAEVDESTSATRIGSTIR